MPGLVLPRQRGGDPGTDDSSAPALPGRRASVAEAPDADAAPAATPTAPSTRQRLGQWLRRHGLVLEATLSLSVAVVAVALSGGSVLTFAPVLAVWAVGTFHAGRAVTSPLSRQFRQTLGAAMQALALAGVIVAFTSTDPTLVRHAVPAICGATLVSAGCRFVRWRLQSPLRVLTVGDRIGVAQATERFRSTRDAEVVGAVVIEADIDDDDVEPDLLGVPPGVTVRVGLESAAGLVREAGADLVVVTPGPGFTSSDLKRLHHTLEDAPVTVGVSGVLDAVAPHRVRAGWVASSTMLDIRSPRPSLWVRAVKTVSDRVLATVLLVGLAPLMLLLMAWVRLDSPGPALFTQSRVGRGGRTFRVVKLRTMTVDAEQVKHALSADDDGSLLFKMREDPRVTRAGEWLRRSSLDELPQLLNVIRGEMSLVGPRPHLPEEIALMSEDERRRLAVAPGMTGLWQVSGRSDLDREESSQLDTFYADNWCLAGDAKILAKTLPAVAKARGAY